MKQTEDTREIAVQVEDVSKTFKLPHEKSSSIKSLVVNFYKRNRSYDLQKALQKVSFDVKKGEFFGIVGRNGSGKSTMLKLLAGIYNPNTGVISVNGKLTPFIELGVGFNPELTGRENVFLNGALLGFSHKEMLAMYNDIVDFAEIKDFMDQKLKNYSSGMQVRLAFSIAIRVKSDILLIDEVLAVGDSAFQRKCYEMFMMLKKQGRTIIFVTHDMSAVERFCDRVLVINKGKMLGIYKPSEASAIYDELNVEKKSKEEEKQEDKEKLSRRWGAGDVMLDKVAFYADGKELSSRSAAVTGMPLEMRFTFKGDLTKNIVVGLAFEDVFGVNISGPNSRGTEIKASQEFVYKIDRLSLVPGTYKVTIAIFDGDAIEEYDHLDKTYTLNVKANSHNLYGKVDLFGEWTAL